MTRTILLADDSVTIQKVVELTFMDEDFRVVSVGSGTEAIERFSEVAPDLVIADVHMPGADGYEVADHIRTARPGTPVLLLAGTFEVFDQERADGVGASAHLKKPFDSQELLRRVRELLEAAPAPAAAPRPVVVPEPAGVPYSAETSEVATLEPSETEWAISPESEPEEGVSWSFESSVEEALPEPPAEAEPQVAAEPEPLPEIAPRSLFEPAPVAPMPPVEPMAPTAASGRSTDALSDDDVERIARRIAELIGDKVVREVAWEVVPDLAEVLLKARIRELESSVE